MRLRVRPERIYSLSVNHSASVDQQLRTLKQLHADLMVLGFTGSYGRVAAFARNWRTDRQRESQTTGRGTFVPLIFGPGEAFQFDWSEDFAVLGGERTKLQVAHIKLSHSRAFLVRAYLLQTHEMLFDTHWHGFRVFGGIPGRGIYDNMSTAVTNILRGKEREYSQRFAQMCSHYLVKPVACTPGAGWEKGQVEKQVRDVRQWLFIPKPKFINLEELNQWLHDRCTQISHERKHPEYKDRTIQDVFKEEQTSLIPVTTEFEGYVEKECSVSSTSLVRYDRNHYSVPCKIAGQTTTIRAKANLILIIENGEQIASHQRIFDREKTIYNPWHYLDVLERKPGALRNGAPFQDWQLPSGLKRLQSRLSQVTGGDRQFVDILFAARLHGVDVTDKVCRKALSQGIIQSDVILNFLARELDTPEVKSVCTPPHLQLKMEPVADCSRYDHLRKGAKNATA